MGKKNQAFSPLIIKLALCSLLSARISCNGKDTLLLKVFSKGIAKKVIIFNDIMSNNILIGSTGLMVPFSTSASIASFRDSNRFCALGARLSPKSFLLSSLLTTSL